MFQLAHQIQQKESVLLNKNTLPEEETIIEPNDITRDDEETISILSNSRFRSFFNEKSMTIDYNGENPSEVETYLAQKRRDNEKSSVYDQIHSVFSSKLTEVKAYSIGRPKLKNLEAINSIIEANTALRNSALNKLKTEPDDAESLEIVRRFDSATQTSEKLTKFLLSFLHKLESLVAVDKCEIALHFLSVGSRINFVDLGNLPEEQKIETLVQYMAAIDEHLK